jgi:MFS family permease
MRHSLVQRGLIALVLVLAMAVWFSASAVVPALASQWHLSAGAAAWLTAPVQAGFVLGAVVSATLGLADRMRPHLLAAGCAASAAACTLVMALLADGPLAGCLLGGWAADRLGRTVTAAAALGLSGACCLLSPLFFTAGRPLLLAFAAVWGAAVIADSGVFSTLLSELADRRYVGTALTAQTAIGFLLTVITIQLIPLLAAVTGWRYAFVALAAGPMTALPAMTTLNRRMRRGRRAIPITATERTSP